MDTVTTIGSFDPAPVIGMTLGSAVILGELARGNMGVVFTAFQQSLKRRIAVKILPQSMYTEESVRLFQQEAEAVAGLSHPGIVPIYEIGETPDFRWFTMQLIEGESLAARLSRMARNVIPSRRVLPLPRALGLVRQILEALAYAHRQGVVHRDVKPENILILNESLLPVLTDFGIARMAASGGDALRIPRGSPLYMAPEQILSTATDERVDVHAAGVLLFRLTVEQLPLIPHRSAAGHSEGQGRGPVDFRPAAVGGEPAAEPGHGRADRLGHGARPRKPFPVVPRFSGGASAPTSANS